MGELVGFASARAGPLMATIASNPFDFAAATVLPAAPEMRPAAGMLRRGAVAYEPPLRALLSLRPWRTEVAIIIAYLVVTRVGSLAAAKFGIQIGPVPLFLTDLTLIALVGLTVLHRPARLLFWVSSGTQAGAVGFAIWILCLLAVVYFLVAFPLYYIYAVRDLAIFAYSLFFPLTYFSISDRALAVRTTRFFVYSGVVVGAMIIAHVATGLDLGLGMNERTVFGQSIAYVGGGDFGGMVAFSFVALTAYLLYERRRRRSHLAAAILCFVAIAATGTRSAFIAIALAGAVTFLLSAPRYRFRFVVLVAVLIGATALGAMVPDAFPGAALLRGFYFAVASGMSGAQDANGAFRLERWQDSFGVWLNHPFFGVGFGADIVNRTRIRGLERLGLFNAGMPHNTYLFLLARLGLFGFALVVFCWASGVLRLVMKTKRFRLPDDLAVLNILVAMAGFAAFVLFFERPMNNASFWIMLAVGQRLAETSARPSIGVTRKSIGASRAARVVYADPGIVVTADSCREEPTTSNGLAVNENHIRKRAYEIYLARNGGPGSETDDWLSAEAELKGHRSNPKGDDISGTDS